MAIKLHQESVSNIAEKKGDDKTKDFEKDSKSWTNVANVYKHKRETSAPIASFYQNHNIPASKLSHSYSPGLTANSFELTGYSIPPNVFSSADLIRQKDRYNHANLLPNKIKK